MGARDAHTFQEEAMIRLLTGVLLLAAAGMTATSQLKAVIAPGQDGGSAQSTSWKFDKPQLLQLIALNEKAARDGESQPVDRKQLIMIYSNLGILYEDAGLYLKAEEAMSRAIELLRNGPQDQLAGEIGQLAVLHASMGKMRQAEKDEMHALQIRRAVGDPMGIALAERDLADLYVQQRKFAKASELAAEAFEVLADRQDVSLFDRLTSRQTLGFTLTRIRNCEQGIQLLKDALALARSSAEVDLKSLGYAEYLLGFGYWNCSDSDHAAIWLEQGTTDMKGGFGWDQALYLNAMREYARFLRENGEQEAAVSAEAIVHQAEAVIDASALAGKAEGFRSAGSN
jgi:tetratricopeptide (TPR) repeat protein